MIIRDDTYALRSRIEIIRKMKSKLTVDLIEQMQNFYELRSQRIAMTNSGAEMQYVEQAEFEAYCKLLDIMGQWVHPPIRVKLNDRKVPKR